METFEWVEVVEFLDNNLNKKFDYCNSCFEGEVSCLAASFFKDKGVDFNHVSYNGFQALTKNSEAVAEIKNAPIQHIRYIHGDLGVYFKTGNEIKNRLEELKKNDYIN